MKIAFNSHIFSSQYYGGISRYFCELAVHLVKNKHDFKIFAPFYRNKYLDDLPKDVVSGIQIKNYPYQSNILFHFLNMVLCKRRIESWNPQLIHETYFTRVPVTSVRSLSIVTVHDMIPELFNHGNKHILSSKKIAIERASHIICVSKNTQKDLLNYFNIPVEKTSVIHLGAKKIPINLTNDWDISVFRQKPYILYVGLRNSYKNFSSFLEAFSSSVRLKKEFNVVAFGGGKFCRSECAHIKHLGLNNKQIVQIGGPDKLLAEFYRNANAFVYPSKYEGFGLSPLEAMAHNCPVVCSNAGSLPEVVGSAAEFFSPYSIDEMAQSLENVVYNKTRSDSLIKLGKERVEKFQWENCADKTVKLYQYIVDSHG